MKTLAAACRFEETIKKSRFITHASPVKTQADTLAFYESVADPQATHNCWAWRIDHIQRSNDDGEPSGSAGRPILAMIQGRELDQLMVVVTRYFGGIKLGIGGLVRAYGGGTAKCLDSAEIVEWQPRANYSLSFDFALTSTVHSLLEQFGVRKISENFEAEGVRLVISVEQTRSAELNSSLADISRGKAVVRRLSAQ
ncbi:MAG: putative YigZ family protein [Lysobacterales bacterium]|jgi:uncharacterized YigZ family protein